jgi:hypothetical protein
LLHIGSMARLSFGDHVFPPLHLLGGSAPQPIARTDRKREGADDDLARGPEYAPGHPSRHEAGAKRCDVAEHRFSEEVKSTTLYSTEGRRWRSTDNSVNSGPGNSPEWRAIYWAAVATVVAAGAF